MELQTNERLELLLEVEKLNSKYDKASPKEIIHDLSHVLFPGEVAVVSSFGIESAVLLHMISDVNPDIAVIFLDTLKHFEITLQYVKDLSASLGLRNVQMIKPNSTKINVEDPHGILHASNPDLCCHIRKTLPMINHLAAYKCFITGRKRFQTSERKDLHFFGIRDGWINLNPLINFTLGDIKSYFVKNQLLMHPLESLGYNSVSCEPCTEKCDEYRAGRWAGKEKTECGIHIEGTHQTK